MLRGKSQVFVFFTGMLAALLICALRNYLFLRDATCYLRWTEHNKRTSLLPRVIVQTYHNLEAVPRTVQRQFEELAPGFPRELFDDASAFAFIKRHFDDDWASLFQNMRVGAHKADLFRYCYLYVKGGIYLDIKTQLVAPLEAICDRLDAQGCSMATCLTEQNYMLHHAWRKACVYQGIIFATPRHPIFLECMEYMRMYAWRGRFSYLTFCRNFTNRLEQRGVERPGFDLATGWTLWTEKVSLSSTACSGARSKRVPFCSVIVDNDSGQTLFVTRLPGFPWK